MRGELTIYWEVNQILKFCWVGAVDLLEPPTMKNPVVKMQPYPVVHSI